jgi:RsiW-degrading membrane proteinase PrsW (M82 family)
MDFFTLMAMAIAPGLAIVVYIYWKDRFDREPRRHLLVSFLLGMLAILPALVLEIAADQLGISGTSLWMVAVVAFGVVALSEELSKFMMLRLYSFRKIEFNEPFDGITYAVMVAMGFATLENIFYVLQYGMGNAILRMFTAVPAHATFGIIMGYYVGLAKFSKNKTACLFQALLYPILMHGAYDFFLMQDYLPGITAGAFLSLILGIVYSRKAIRIHQDRSPFRT